MRNIAALTAVLLALPAAACLAGAGTSPDIDSDQNWLALLAEESSDAHPSGLADPNAHEDPCKDRKGVPLPFHCIEGYSGGAITPLAYLCNYCNCGCGGKDLVGPSVSYSFMGIGTKHLHTIAVTQALWNRIEFGYAVNRLTIGSLYDDIRKVGMDTVRDDLYLHNFNVRAKILDENSFGLPLPAISAGVHFKYNYGLKQMNRRVGKAFSSIGLDKHYGVDYTLTATKMFPTLAFGRPLILTGGIRFSKAAQLGLLGFSKTCRASFEGSVVCLATDWLVLGYEFRQMRWPYGELQGLVENGDNWHALSASVIVNKHLTISGLAGIIGNVANANEDTTWGVQVKWEF